MRGFAKVLKDQLEDMAAVELGSRDAIVQWMIRWAAELISKYAVGEDGKIPYERFRKEDCVTPLVAFGKTVRYLPLKIVH